VPAPDIGSHGDAAPGSHRDADDHIRADNPGSNSYASSGAHGDASASTDLCTHVLSNG